MEHPQQRFHAFARRPRLQSTTVARMEVEGITGLAPTGNEVSSGALDSNIYAVYPYNRHLSAKVRAFIDFLRQRIGPRPYWEVDDREACATAPLEPLGR
jgi:DNA-binding transcriptional LysR family regulator